MKEKIDKGNIYFLGQNSHGTSEVWVHRLNFIVKNENRNKNKGKFSVVIECPTLDVLQHLGNLTKYRKDISMGNVNTVYWWMKSDEVCRFIQRLFFMNEVDIYGIDVSFIKKEEGIKIIELMKSKEKYLQSTTSKLLNIDLVTTDTDTPEQRETTMEKKLSTILKCKYKNIYVLCHIFHASKKSWLPHNSLCEMITEKHANSHNVLSYAFFSRNMTFISTNSINVLKKNKLKNAIMKYNKKSYFAKIVSAFFECEKKDIIRMKIKKPHHFDKIIIANHENPIKIKEAL